MGPSHPGGGFNQNQMTGMMTQGNPVRSQMLQRQLSQGNQQQQQQQPPPQQMNPYHQGGQGHF